MTQSSSPPRFPVSTGIPELDAFMLAEIELIQNETNQHDQQLLWRIFYKGMRTILSAQLQAPVSDTPDYAARSQRKIDIIKRYLGETHG